jgi:hypothetical protein
MDILFACAAERFAPELFTGSGPTGSCPPGFHNYPILLVFWLVFYVASKVTYKQYALFDAP